MLYFKRNLPTWERGLRLCLGVLVASAALYGLASGVMMTVALLGAVTLAGTALFGFCPACAVLGRTPRTHVEMIPTHHALIDAARAGDAGAIAQLLTVCQPDLKRFARRACSNSEDAEDAVQAALWQLYRKIGALRMAATFATWLFRIVERECYRLLRGRQIMDSMDEPAAQGVAAQQVPLDLRIDLSRAISALPASYREVLILRDVDELTAPEVAAQLGLSLEAVKSLLHRARVMVREVLMNSGYWLKDGASQEDSSKEHNHVL